MSDPGAKHRVIGIRHTLKKFKDEGLVEEESLYPADAIANVQDGLTRKAITWYKVGARRGAREVLDAILDGRLEVKHKSDGATEIVASVDTLEWKKRLNVRIGNSKSSVRSRKYKLTTEHLGFE